MSQSYPLVSVVIPTLNRATLLKRAIDSALNQSYSNIEIIVINDGSKDNTRELLYEYMKKFPNISCIHHDKPMGGNFSRNDGIKMAKGKFIAGLDDDDEFTPDRIWTLLNAYHDNFSLICSRSVVITKAGNKKTRFFPRVDLDKMLYFNIIGNQVLVRKERIVGAGLFDENLIRSQDYDMWIRIIIKYGTAKMISNITQIIHQDHNIYLHKDQNKLIKGKFYFYKKYKKLMNHHQRQFHLCNIYLIQKKTLTFNRLLTFASFNTMPVIIKFIVSNSFSNFNLLKITNND